jgi:hypothetical protein
LRILQIDSKSADVRLQPVILAKARHPTTTKGKDTVKKTQLLETLRRERADWEALLAQVDQARMTRPGVAGAWSVKDVITHE